MPIPPRPNLNFDGVPGCAVTGVNLTPPALIACLLEADAEQIDAIRNAIIPGGIGQNYGLDDLTLIASNASDAQKNAFTQRMGMASTTYAPGLTNIVESLDEEQQAQLWCTAIKQAANVQALTTELVRVEQGVAESFDIIPEVCGAQLLLTLTQEQAQKVDTKQVTVTFQSCEGEELVQTAALVADNGVGGQVDDGAWRQKVIDMLAALLTCCPPCTEQFVKGGDLQVTAGQELFDVPPNMALARIYYSDASDVNASTAWFAKPDIKLLAKMRWLYADGNIGPVMFLNSDHQEIRPVRDDVIGFAYWLYPGVELTYQAYARQAWLKGLQ